MQRLKKESIEWLEFDLLADIPRLKHAVVLRHGGQSNNAFTGLNISHDVGDSADNVTANLKAIQMTLGFSEFKWAKQVHGDVIAHITTKSPQETPAVDALMTSRANLTLMIKHADCQAAIFYDPQNRAIANVHAGWRGTLLNIYAKTLETMKNTFGTRPDDVLACISPSLGSETAEFVNYKEEIPEKFWDFQTRHTYFDFWSISEQQLIDAGVLPHHIEIARLCTYSNPIDYFSYRRDKITGRHGTFVELID